MPLSVRIQRLGYRLAFRLLMVLRRLRQPHRRGVKCLLTHRGRLLLVLHTYGPREWDLPGGSMRRAESPLETVRREMAEELGVTGGSFRPAGRISARGSRGEDLVHLFTVELEDDALRPAPAELAAVRWCDPRDPPLPLSRYVQPVLAAWRDGAIPTR